MTPQALEGVEGAAGSQEAAAIDAVVAAFYSMFDNRDGPSPLLAAPERVFLREARIVRRDGDDVLSMALEDFLAPRRRWLSDGTLAGFHEYETAASTSVAGGIAVRRSRYRKQGLRDGVSFDGDGAKALQLVRTAAGWRIASVLWDDGAGAWGHGPNAS